MTDYEMGYEAGKVDGSRPHPDPEVVKDEAEFWRGFDDARMELWGIDDEGED